MLAALLLPTLHNWFLRHVKSGTSLVARLQKFRSSSLCSSSPLDSLCLLFSTAGCEVTYMVLIMFTCWNIDMALARRVAVLWGAGFYLANFMKDLLLLPRPYYLSGNLVALDVRHGDHYGLPCVRSFSATCISVYLLYSFHKCEDCGTALCIAIVWSLLVSFSRVYLCTHTPADVVAAHVLGLQLTIIWVVCENHIDHSIIKLYSWLPWTCPLVSLLLLMSYPAPPTQSPSFTETSMVIGFTTGWVTGSSWVFLQFIRDPIICMHSDCAWLVVLRTLVGLLVVLVTYVSALRFFVVVVPPMNCFTPRPNNFNRLSILKKSSTNVGSVHFSNGTRASTEMNPQTNGHVYRNGTHDPGNGKKGSKGATAANPNANSKLWDAKAVLLLCVHTSRQWTSRGYERAVPVLYLTYVCVGFNASFTAQLVIRLAGL